MMRRHSHCDVPVAEFAWMLLLVCANIYTLAKRVSWSTVMRALSRTWMYDI